MEIQTQKTRRLRTGLKKNITHIGKLKSGSLITVIPRFLVEKKDITNIHLLKWSDGGENRILVEITSE